MLRVLHLSDCLADFSAGRASASLAQQAGDEFRIESRTIGRGGDYRNPVGGFFMLRGDAAEQFDLVHAWSSAALWLAVFAGARAIVYSPVQLLPRRSIVWLLAAMNRRNIHLVCASESEQRFYTRNGIHSQCCTVIGPGMDVTAVDSKRDPALRAALGFAHDDYVLLAPGESTRQAGHREALWAAGILHVLDPRYRLLIWGRGAKAQVCLRLAGKIQQAATLVAAEQKLGRKIDFAELLSAADVVLFVPGGPTPVLPVALCMAAGLPIVATPTPWFGDLLKDGQNSVVVSRRSSRMVAQCVTELQQDAGRQTRIGDAARNEARRLFAPGQFIERYRDIYRNIVKRSRA